MEALEIAAIALALSILAIGYSIYSMVKVWKWMDKENENIYKDKVNHHKEIKCPVCGEKKKLGELTTKENETSYTCLTCGTKFYNYGK